MSSRFSGAIPFRPTPATCWPPLPPPPQLPECACIGITAAPVAVISTVITYRHDDPDFEMPGTALNTAVATTYFQGQSQIWSAIINSADCSPLMTLLRCTNGQFWETKSSGRIRTPEGLTIQFNEDLNSGGNPTTTIENGNPRVEWWTSYPFQSAGHWTIASIRNVLYFTATIPRSRPPNPMIPNIA